ncbi:hypothetical protein [Streptomyces sp. NPDC050355]|uniref:hypothetical protein n=1 Tax=Streptomyces sp. NPDC050355 TaxID=3365609 RepID=UPI0037BC97DA
MPPTAGPSGPAAVFFGVDETLATFKTLFGFCDFFLAAVGYSSEEHQCLRQKA